MKNSLELLKNSFKNAYELGLPDPNSECVTNSYTIISYLDSFNIKVDFINPIVEGGVMIEFNKNGIYHMFEIYNDGDIILLKRDGNKREVFDNFNSVYKYLGML